MNPFRQSAEVPDLREMSQCQLDAWRKVREVEEANASTRTLSRTIVFCICLVTAMLLGASLKGCQMTTNADIESAKYHADCPTAGPR